MGKNTLLWLAAAGFAGWYFLLRRPDRNGQVAYLQKWVVTSSPVDASMFMGKVTSMSDAEVETVYEYIHDYVTRGKNLVEGSDLFNRLMAVSNKYQIFT